MRVSGHTVLSTVREGEEVTQTLCPKGRDSYYDTGENGLGNQIT